MQAPTAIRKPGDRRQVFSFSGNLSVRALLARVAVVNIPHHVTERRNFPSVPEFRHKSSVGRQGLTAGYVNFPKIV
jgi:hypothetical protein